MKTNPEVTVARNALGIYNGGACNTSAIVKQISIACEVARAEAGTEAKAEKYAPMRLMIAQLCWLTGQGIGTYGSLEADIKYCEDLVNKADTAT